MDLEATRIWCAKAHGEQKYNEHPYSFHLQNVEDVALRFGFEDSTLRKACWTHDVLEDTTFSEKDLRDAGFDAAVIALAQAVTDEPGETRHERKLKTYPKIKATPQAVLVKLFDRIANIEQSLKNNPRKLEKYRLEYADFAKYLRDTDDAAAAPLWNHLDALLK
jgi:(p)ppGpp synthase/HD superfamily hydrolase